MITQVLNFLQNVDTTIFYFINHTTKNNFFDFIMPIITNHKNFFIVFLILWFLLVFSSHYRYRIAGWSIIVGVAFSDILSSKILKHLFLRQRPFETLDNVYKLVSSAGPSFPSSHAVNSFTVATLIMLFLRNTTYSVIAFAVATLSAYSRVYVGVHYPSDIVCGAVLGYLIGLSIYKIVSKVFKLDKKE